MTGEALKPPWEPCTDAALGGQDTIYSMISSVNVRHLKTELNIEDHRRRCKCREPECGPMCVKTGKPNYNTTDTHWQDVGVGPDHNDPVRCEWRWQDPQERNPVTSTYPLLAVLLGFCMDSPSALKYRSDPCGLSPWQLLGRTLQSLSLPEPSAGDFVVDFNWALVQPKGRLRYFEPKTSEREVFIERLQRQQVLLDPEATGCSIKFFSMKRSATPHMMELWLSDPNDLDPSHKGRRVGVHVHFGSAKCEDCWRREKGELKDYQACGARGLAPLAKLPLYEEITGVNVRHEVPYWPWIEEHWEGGRSIHECTHWQENTDSTADGPSPGTPWKWRVAGEYDKYPLLHELLDFCLSQAINQGQKVAHKLRNEPGQSNKACWLSEGLKAEFRTAAVCEPCQL